MFVSVKITNHFQLNKIDISQTRHITNLSMADPRYNVPTTIVVLQGADVTEEVMLDNRIRFNINFLLESIFDWTVSDPIKTTTADFEATYFSCHGTTSPTTDSLLSRFWALDEVPGRERKLLTLEKQHKVRNTFCLQQVTI